MGKDMSTANWTNVTGKGGYIQHYPHEPSTTPWECSKYDCPDGFRPRWNNGVTSCAGIPCRSTDRDTCCKEKGWQWWLYLLFALGVCCCCCCLCGLSGIPLLAPK